jgi:hypothetical protein
MTRRWKVTLCLLATFAFGACCIGTFNPLSSARRSDKAIEEEILAATPIGTTAEEVERYAKAHFVQDNFFHWIPNGEKERILTCFYGSYTELQDFPFSTCVSIYWYFSGDGALTKVSVSRWFDGP